METKALIDNLHLLTDMAYNSSAGYIRGKINDLKNGEIFPDYEVESIYDMILDFCFDHRFLDMFNELTTVTIENYPSLTKDYIKAYHQLWGEE